MQIATGLPRPTFTGFQLPAIHQDIPARTVMISSGMINETEAARTLYQIGIIDPETISSEVQSTRDLLKYGIGAWLRKRMGNLNRIVFDCSIISQDNANAFVENCQDAGQHTYTGSVFCLKQVDTREPYMLDDKAKQLEKACTGLFAVALAAIDEAMGPGVPVLMPNDLFSEFCCSWYGTDSSCVSTPDDIQAAMDELKERFDDKVPAMYKPENTKKVFGWQYYECRSSEAHRGFTKKKLLSIAGTSRSTLVKNVAKAIVDLRDSIEHAKKCEASLPDLTDIHAYPVHLACSIFFKDHELTWQTIDEKIDHAWNCGDNTEMLGMRQMPTDPDGLKTFFHKLDVAFVVVQRMDDLITLITKPLHPEEE